MLVLEVIVRFGVPQVFCVLWLSVSLIVPAAELAGLYEAEIDVQAKDDASRSVDIRRALEQVLSRLITADALQSDKVRPVLDNAQAFVRQYGYLDRPAGAGQSGDPAQSLRIVFDETKLTAALRDRGIAVFGAQRPDVLAWIAVEDQQQQQLVSADSLPEFDAALNAAARERAVPVMLPLWDLSDQQALSFNDVWSANDERIRQASLRYGAKAVLAGRLQHRADGAWEGTWRFYRPGGVSAWNGQYPALPQAMQAGMQGAYNELATHLASARPATTNVDLQVSGIGSLADFVRVVDYLQSLSSVRSVDWLLIQPDAVEFRLAINGDKSTLDESLAPGLVLQPTAGIQGGSEMIYRLATP